MVTRLLADFLSQRVFTLEEVKARYGLSDHAAKQAVQYAKSRGQIGAVRPGLYYVVPPGTDPGAFRPDPYLVASKAAPAGLLAYHAALDLHGVAYSAFYEVAVAVPRWRRGFRVGAFQVRFVVAPTTFGADTVTREGVPVRVTDRERTVVDGTDRPRYAGGLEEYLRSVASFPSVDHRRVLEYVRRYGRSGLASKVGWVLDRLSELWGFPEDVRSELQGLRARGPVAFERGGRLRYDREWGVLVPATLEERLAGV